MSKIALRENEDECVMKTSFPKGHIDLESKWNHFIYRDKLRGVEPKATTTT